MVKEYGLVVEGEVIRRVKVIDWMLCDGWVKIFLNMDLFSMSEFDCGLLGLWLLSVICN